MILTFLTLSIAIIVGVNMVHKEPSPPYLSNNPNLVAWEARGKYHTFTEHPPMLKIFYQDHLSPLPNSSETLVIIHGFPSSSIDFEKSLPILATRFKRIVLFDHPGFGLSDKPPGHQFAYSMVEYTDSMLSLLKALDVKEAHFLAHDMGDSVLTELAARQAKDLLPHWFKGARSLTFTNGKSFFCGENVLTSFFVYPANHQHHFFLLSSLFFSLDYVWYS